MTGPPIKEKMEVVSGVSVYSYLAFLAIFGGYLLKSTCLQYLFYFKRGGDLSWKIQKKHDKHVNEFFWWPLFSSKPNRGKYHAYITSFNLLMASTFAATVTEVSMRRWNLMAYDEPSTYGFDQIILDLVIAVTYENIIEYFWHLGMHTKTFYAMFHKYHHFYKSPEVWDDMYIHPVEAFGYYCILYGPPFLFRCHYLAFLAYMVLMGVCGVLDHCGAKFSIPGVYNTEDHDAHHEKFEVNYCFPFPYMDIIFGTFEGTFLGVRFTRKVRR